MKHLGELSTKLDTFIDLKFVNKQELWEKREDLVFSLLVKSAKNIWAFLSPRYSCDMSNRN